MADFGMDSPRQDPVVTGRDRTGDSPTLFPKPGILVLTPGLKLITLNAEAQQIMDELVGAETGMHAKGVFPSQFRDICRKVARDLSSSRDESNLDHTAMARTITLDNGVVSLICFPIVSPPNPGDATIVLFMWRGKNLHEEAIALAKKRFSLTSREVTVLECLTRGLTNKEIAAELHIVEQTVKDHVKNIMQKTQSKTRTGLVSRTLQLK